MKTLRIVATCAAALIAGQAWAQTTAVSQQDATQGAQDVGGVPPGSASGMATGITRQQVYNELIRSQQSGELKELQQGLYRGGN